MDENVYVNTVNISTTIPISQGISNSYYDWNPVPIGNFNYITWSYPNTVYKYQIQCPSCEKFNWLELDKITTCTTTKCGTKLKAVSQKADHEIEVST